jgi:coenzyme PQQ synthesis protein D (PqqD)
MTHGLSLASRARISAHVLFRDLEGEAVLLEMKRGVYFGLDPIGTRIWHLLLEERSLGDVVAMLVAEYEVGETQGAEDILALVGQLQEQGLVDVHE